MLFTQHIRKGTLGTGRLDQWIRIHVSPSPSPPSIVHHVRNFVANYVYADVRYQRQRTRSRRGRGRDRDRDRGHNTLNCDRALMSKNDVRR